MSGTGNVGLCLGQKLVFEILVDLEPTPDGTGGNENTPQGCPRAATSRHPFWFLTHHRSRYGFGNVDEGFHRLSVDHRGGLQIVNPWLDIGTNVFAILLEKGAGVERAREEAEIIRFKSLDDGARHFRQIHGIIHRDAGGFARGAQGISERLVHFVLNSVRHLTI